jgi:DNA-binding protein YbaB
VRCIAASREFVGLRSLSVHSSLTGICQGEILVGNASNVDALCRPRCSGVEKTGSRSLEQHMSEHVSGGPRTAEETERWLSEYQRQSQELLERSQAVGAELATMTETVTSRNGLVKVTVGPSGTLRHVEFSEQTRALGRAELAALLMDTASRAQAQIAHKVAEIVTPLAGDGNTMQFIRDQLPPLQHAEGNSAGQSAEHDFDEFENQTFLK